MKEEEYKNTIELEYKSIRVQENTGKTFEGYKNTRIKKTTTRLVKNIFRILVDILRSRLIIIDFV